jgi:hypothetical protein
MGTLGKLGLAAALATALAAPAQAGCGWSVGVSFGGPVCFRPYCGYYYRPYPVYIDAPPLILPPPAPVTIYTVPAPTANPAPGPSPVPAPNPSLLPPPKPAPAAVVAASAPSAGDYEGCKAQLSATDDKVRADAAIQLGRLKEARAIEPLRRALQSDGSANVREASARALGLIGDVAALKALQYAAQADPDREVRHSAQFAAEVIRSSLPR